MAQTVNLIMTNDWEEKAMAVCRCTEKDMCQRDLNRLSKAGGANGDAASDDSEMNSNLNDGKGNVPSSFTSDKEGDLLSSVDDVHNEMTDKISGCSSEISEAVSRVQSAYRAYCFEDAIYHAEEALKGH